MKPGYERKRGIYLYSVTAGGGRAMRCEARKFVFLVFAFLILSAFAGVSAARTIYEDYSMFIRTDPIGQQALGHNL